MALNNCSFFACRPTTYCYELNLNIVFHEQIGKVLQLQNNACALFGLCNLRYFNIYIIGSLASVMFLPKDNTVSVGASTVIFGVMGGLLSYMTINWTSLGRVRSQLCCIVGLITFLGVLTSLNGEVDLAGHLGGMFGGYTCGIALFPGIRQKDKRFIIAGGSALAIYVLVMLLVFYL